MLVAAAAILSHAGYLLASLPLPPLVLILVAASSSAPEGFSVVSPFLITSLSVVAPRHASVASCRPRLFPFTSCISVRHCFFFFSHSPFGSVVSSGRSDEGIEVKAVMTIRKTIKENFTEKLEDQWEYFINGVSKGIQIQLISDQIDPTASAASSRRQSHQDGSHETAQRLRRLFSSNQKCFYVRRKMVRERGPERVEIVFGNPLALDLRLPGMPLKAYLRRGLQRQCVWGQAFRS